MLLKSLIGAFFVLVFAVGRAAMPLQEPITEQGGPEPGKRVKVDLDGYPGVYYFLFLPYNYAEGSSYGVIGEVCCRHFQAAVLGYGLSKGMDYILVTLPILNDEGQILDFYYPQDPEPTANCWLAILEDLNKRFSINNEQLIVAGFSRGAICVNFIGNCNDIISAKWAAFFVNAHFDGCCQLVSGNVEERMSRIGGRRVLIAVGENDIARSCSLGAYNKLCALGASVCYIEAPDVITDLWKNCPDHNPYWIMEDSAAAQAARDWLKRLF